MDNAESPGAFADNQRIASLNVDIKMNIETNTLMVNRKFHFGGNGTILFPVNSYSAVKNLFDIFHKSDTHTITLKKD